MTQIIVTNAEKGKFKVMVNFVQYGCAYGSRNIANHEAQKIGQTMKGAVVKVMPA